MTFMRKFTSVKIDSFSTWESLGKDNRFDDETEKPILFKKYLKKFNVCLKPGCAKAARNVLTYVDKSADPCDNFYEFACGTFLKKAEIDESVFSNIGKKVQNELKSIFEMPSSKYEARPFRMVKDLYKTCIYNHKSKAILPSVSSMKNILRRIGGWPALEGDQWDASKFTWEDTDYKMKQEGLNTDWFINLSIEMEPNNRTKNVIWLNEPKTELRKRVGELRKHKKNIPIWLGLNQDDVKNGLIQSMKFEDQFANVTESIYMTETDKEFEVTIQQLQQRYPSINWVEYFSKLLHKDFTTRPDQVVIVQAPRRMKALDSLLHTTPKRILANYMFWSAFMENLKFILAFSSNCVSHTTDSLYLAVSSLYVSHFYKQETTKIATEIALNIRKEFEKGLKTLKWLDQETRENALEKARGMISYIGHPEELLNIQKLEKYYQKLNITKRNFFEEILNIKKFNLDFSFEQLDQPINEYDWMDFRTSFKVIAHNRRNRNSILISPAIMQGEFLSYDRPRYMNYGAIGFVIAHEIIHGFDTKGRKRDKDGHVVNWWSPDVEETFLEKAECFIDQYNNYTVEKVGMNVDGELTKDENIADNGGITYAYRAYNRWVAEHGPERRLPGFEEFTPKQMFWISTAIPWCSNARPESLQNSLTSDVHSPEEFRVRGTFSNSPEFANDFKCPPGSKMNPTKKCKVW